MILNSSKFYDFNNLTCKFFTSIFLNHYIFLCNTIVHSCSFTFSNIFSLKYENILIFFQKYNYF